MCVQRIRFGHKTDPSVRCLLPSFRVLCFFTIFCFVSGNQNKKLALMIEVRLKNVSRSSFQLVETMADSCAPINKAVTQSAKADLLVPFFFASQPFPFGPASIVCPRFRKRRTGGKRRRIVTKANGAKSNPTIPNKSHAKGWGKKRRKSGRQWSTDSRQERGWSRFQNFRSRIGVDSRFLPT